MKKALLEAFFVVFGVALAFLANEWREHRIEQAKSQAALSAILDEIESNRAVVAASNAYHYRLLELLDERAKADAPMSVADFPRGFVFPAQLSDSSWRSASETGALGQMPFETVRTLGAAYAAQSAYREQTQVVSAIIFGDLYEKGAAGVSENPRGVRALISTFAFREREIDARYGETLEKLAPPPPR